MLPRTKLYQSTKSFESSAAAVMGLLKLEQLELMIFKFGETGPRLQGLPTRVTLPLPGRSYQPTRTGGYWGPPIPNKGPSGN